MKRATENNIKKSLRKLTALRNQIYKEFDNAQKIDSPEKEQKSDEKISELILSIRGEADSLFWMI